MGQYYQIVNLDKKEYLCPLDYGCGDKLTEFSFTDTCISKAFMNLITTEWKGDNIVVAGDYSALEAVSETDSFFESLSYLYDKYHLPEDKSIYEIASESYLRRRNVNTELTEDYPYILNEDLGTYISLDNLPKHYYDWALDPLILFLAAGNGYGGGDYWGVNEENVGGWIGTSEYISFSKEKPENMLEEDYFGGI